MIRRNFGRFAAGGIVDESTMYGDTPDMATPSIAGAGFPDTGIRNKSMGDVFPPKEKFTPQEFADKNAAMKRMKQTPGNSPLGPLTSGPPQGQPQGRMPQGQPQGQPQGRMPQGPPQGQQQQQGGIGGRWMGELWQGLTMNPVDPMDPQMASPQMGGYASGGAVGPDMSIYHQTMRDLESGGVSGYAQGGMISDSGADTPWSTQPPSETPYEDTSLPSEPYPDGTYDSPTPPYGDFPEPPYVEDTPRPYPDETYDFLPSPQVPYPMPTPVTQGELFRTYSNSYSTPTPNRMPRTNPWSSWPGYRAPSPWQPTRPAPSPSPPYYDTGTPEAPSPRPPYYDTGNPVGEAPSPRPPRTPVPVPAGDMRRPWSGMYNNNPITQDEIFGSGIRSIGNLDPRPMPIFRPPILDGRPFDPRPPITPTGYSPRNRRPSGQFNPYIRNQPNLVSQSDLSRTYPGYAQGGLVEQSKEIASKGRYGDSMLMHIQPEELEGLQSLLGPLTTNPETGNPEAFAISALLGGLVIGGALGAGGSAALGGNKQEILTAAGMGAAVGAGAGIVAAPAAPVAGAAPIAASATTPIAGAGFASTIPGVTMAGGSLPAATGTTLASTAAPAAGLNYAGAAKFAASALPTAMRMGSSPPPGSPPPQMPSPGPMAPPQMSRPPVSPNQSRRAGGIASLQRPPGGMPRGRIGNSLRGRGIA